MFLDQHCVHIDERNEVKSRERPKQGTCRARESKLCLPRFASQVHKQGRSSLRPDQIDEYHVCGTHGNSNMNTHPNPRHRLQKAPKAIEH